jgi:hypothetical protein
MMLAWLKCVSLVKKVSIIPIAWILRQRIYSLYASEVGAESKNSSIVTPVTCFDVKGELQITVRWSRGKTLENQAKSIGLTFPLLTSINSFSGGTKSISCSFDAQ